MAKFTYDDVWFKSDDIQYTYTTVLPKNLPKSSSRLSSSSESSSTNGLRSSEI